MSETPDKRRRADLDLFILALIECGVSTPYELQRAAGISQGASIPALQRLLESHFVRQGEAGVRGRAAYTVSAAGRKALQSGWRPLVDQGPTGDLDADLRIALLALRGGDRRLAQRFLGQSADKKKESLTSVEQANRSEVAPLAREYRRLRLAAAKMLTEAEYTAAQVMAESLPRTLAPTNARRKLGADT